MPITLECKWWNHNCNQPATYLILASCQQGHIREKLLCIYHALEFTKHIDSTDCFCPQCPDMITNWMAKTPIQPEWDLTGTLLDQLPILITFTTEPPPIPPFPITSGTHNPADPFIKPRNPKPKLKLSQSIYENWKH